MKHDLSLYNHNICEGAEDSPLEFHSDRVSSTQIDYTGSKLFLKYSHYNKDNSQLSSFLFQKYNAEENNNIFSFSITFHNLNIKYSFDLSKENSIEVTQVASFAFTESKEIKDVSADAIIFGKLCSESAQEIIQEYLQIMQ